MKNPATMNFLIFISFLVLGYSISIRFYQPGFGYLPDTSSIKLLNSSKSIPTLNNGQRSILLVSVNSTQPIEARLESIWLVTNLPPDTSLKFLPIIYPGKGISSDLENKLEDSFKLENKNGNLVLSQDFIGLLKENNFWWSGYIILDQVAVKNMIHNFASPGYKSELSYASAFDFSLLREVCHGFSSASSDEDSLEKFLLDQNHLVTDMDRIELIKEWKTLTSTDQKPACMFPTLEIVRVYK